MSELNVPNGQATKPEQGDDTLPTKKELVRQALDDLGRKTKPKKLQEHIRSKFGVDMKTPQISSYKTQLKKERRKRKATTTKPQPTPETAPKEQTSTPDERTSGTLEVVDCTAIRDLRGLVKRLGVEKVKELADAVA